MSQVEDVEAALRLPHVRCSQSRGSAALAHIANCPSNVRWRRLQTDGRLFDTLTEHSSLWSMSSLSSPCRTETAWIFTMGTSQAALWNVMLSTQQSNQKVMLQGVAERWRDDAHSEMGRCCQLLLFQRTDSLRSSEHKWVRMTLVRTCCGLISFQIAAAKKFAWESHWVKWKQSWDFCTFQVHKIEVLRHLRTLPTVPAMSVGDVCRQMADYLIPWLNIVHCGLVHVFFVIPLQDGDSLDFHHGD